jgi:hypothetical protein
MEMLGVWVSETQLKALAGHRPMSVLSNYNCIVKSIKPFKFSVLPANVQRRGWPFPFRG